MKPWESRPEEIANLLNPAFCGEIIRRSVEKYYDNSDSPFQYPLLYLILPIVLHRYTRDRINPIMRKQMHVWIQENQSVRIGFAERARQLRPVTNESILFLLQLQAANINEDGSVRINKYKRVKIDGHQTGEIADIFKKAEIIGKWFSSAGTTSTIFTMWGVKP